MARPKGNPMSRPAWEDILRLTGRSLTEVAELADVPRSTLSGLSRGHQRASVPQAHKIARALDIHPATLFPGLILESTKQPIEAAS